MKTPSTPAEKAAVQKFADDVQGLFLNLYDRWQDEKEYENIADYGDAIKKHMPSQFTFVKMSKRPFAFHFSIGEKTGYQLYADRRGYGWRR